MYHGLVAISSDASHHGRHHDMSQTYSTSHQSSASCNINQRPVKFQEMQYDYADPQTSIFKFRPGLLVNLHHQSNSLKFQLVFGNSLALLFSCSFPSRRLLQLALDRAIIVSAALKKSVAGRTTDSLEAMEKVKEWLATRYLNMLKEQALPPTEVIVILHSFAVLGYNPVYSMEGLEVRGLNCLVYIAWV